MDSDYWYWLEPYRGCFNNPSQAIVLAGQDFGEVVGYTEYMIQAFSEPVDIWSWRETGPVRSYEAVRQIFRGHQFRVGASVVGAMVPEDMSMIEAVDVLSDLLGVEVDGVYWPIPDWLFGGTNATP